MALGLLWLWRLIEETRNSSFKEAFQKEWLLFVVCGILFIGFVAMMKAPGNEVRMNLEGRGDGFMHQFDLAAFIKTSIIANTIFILRLLSKGLYWLGVLPICIYIGSRMREYGLSIENGKISKKIWIFTALLLGFIIIAVTSCVYGIGYYPPLRSMSFMSYVVVAYLCYVGCLIGYAIYEKKSAVINTLVVIVSISWIGYADYRLFREYPEVRRYHEYVVQRDTAIKQLAEQGSTELYYVDSYQPPVWRNSYSYLRTGLNRLMGSKKVVNEPYFPYMVSVLDKNNTSDFRNVGVKNYYNANFEILEK